MRTVLVAVLFACLCSAASVAAPPTPGRDACTRLRDLGLPDAKVLSAEVVGAGAFTPPERLSPWLVAEPGFYEGLPAFCRIVVEATPSADSDIRIEIWMPLSGWNGRFRGQGNGGFAGEIDYKSLGMAVARGYATAGTDTGHAALGTDARWALGHPEKVLDYGFRAIHVMTTLAKKVVASHHGRPARYSYFSYCSNGGRQALMEAQRFPEDYDGIVAGAPAHAWSLLMANALAVTLATNRDPASYIPPSKIPAIARAVNAACDARDGVTDSVVDDPRSCPFDPRTLVCREADSDACLTPAQAGALTKVYQGVRDSDGQELFPGLLPGAEDGPGGWGDWVTGAAPGKGHLFAFATQHFGQMVYERADWDSRQAHIDEALKATMKKTAHTTDATNPDLSAFAAHGGKLILYHGWNDPAIPATATVRYYDSVVERLGQARTDSFVRLYMIPGMKHCNSGPGPNAFGHLGAPPVENPQCDVARVLERWRETGEAPSTIVATKFVDDDPAKGVKATRPLCPYPQVATWDGAGDPTNAASYRCRLGSTAR